MTCPHCQYLDVPEYQDEAPICPSCGAILAEPEPVSWLAQWPPERRSGLAQLFYAAVRRGYTAPPAIVEQVVAAIHHRLQWATAFETRQWWSQVCNTISDAPQWAQMYAAEVLATEQLPRAERERRKEARAKTYMQQAMQGKPATDKQRWLLGGLGYRGTLPTDRAEASALIDQLLQTKGGAA
jgi:hypothetical protein